MITDNYEEIMEELGFDYDDTDELINIMEW